MNNPKDILLEEEQFLKVVDECKGIITKICYFYSENSDDFNDLRQDVLAAMWQSRSSYRGKSNIKTWIYRIALNTSISNLRRKKHRGTRLSLDAVKELPADEPTDITLYKEMFHLINSLKATEKAIILLWLDEMPYDEIANIIGIPRNTLATRLRRIKQTLMKAAAKNK